MRALRAMTPGRHQVELTEVPEATELQEGEVVVATRAVGVCGSDIHAWHGTQTYRMSYPVTLGHEAMGVVTRVGPGVSTVQLGARVVSETARSVCGVCRPCREGLYNLCEKRLGFGALCDGAMADSFVTRAQILHGVPDNLSDEIAATAEPYCVAYNTVVEGARLQPGDAVAVIGPGPIGVFAAQLAAVSGAADVLVAGVRGDEARLEVSKQFFGATEVLVAEGQWWERPAMASAFDVVFDASGVSATLEAAFGLVRAHGQVVKVGWGREAYGRSLDPLVAKAVNLHGSFSHTWTTWERVVRLLSLGRLDPRAGLQSYAFSDWHEAFSAMSERHVLKSVLLL